MDFTLGATLLTLLAVLLAIQLSGRERPLSRLTPVLGMATAAGTTTAYLVATGVSLNPTAVAAALAVGLLLGLMQSRSTRAFYRGPTLMVKQGSGYLVLWGLAYLLTLGLAQLQSAALHAAGLLAMLFGSGLAVGANLGLLATRPPAPSPAAGPLCAQCGSELKPGAAFCGACGTPAPAPAPTTCASCGQPLTPTARFCSACGASTGPTTALGRG